MKAKFIALNGAMALVLANGTVFEATAKETQEKFLKRVQADVELDLGELEIQELTTASFVKIDDVKLAKAIEKEKDGPLKNLLTAALAERSADGKVETKPTDTSKEDAKAEKAAKALEAKKAKAKEKAEKAAAKANVVKPTLEEIQAKATAAKENVGHIVSFTPHGIAVPIEGVVNGVWIDKRVPMALYRIFDADGKMYNKTIEAPELKFGDLAPDTKAEEKAAKEAEKTAKKEAAEKEKAEKAAAKETEKAAKAAKALEAKEAKAKAAAEKEAAAKASTVDGTTSKTGKK